MVMRGDGGATDLAGFRTAPARTLYSGPAASVAGALRSGRVEDAVILEVGGTSTNVAAIRRGRPALSYVQVASHATAIRALDVRVLGVAGGSMLRVRKGQVYGVGPRSAHIAALPYACFVAAGDLEEAEVELIAPRDGDPPDYLVLRAPSGERIALTNTCAANALGIVEDRDYARGDPTVAMEAFDLAGRHLGIEGREVARRMLAASTQAVGDLVTEVIRDHKLQSPGIVAVGGGAGALGRSVAAGMGLSVTVPDNAEVISAIGDALSLIRAERERTFASPTPEAIEQLIAEVEAEAINAGAAAASLDTRVDHLAERGAVRVTATGAVGLQSGAVPGRRPLTEPEIRAVAEARGYPGVDSNGAFWVASDRGRKPRVAVFDQYGDLVIDIAGERFDARHAEDLAVVLDRQTRRIGVMSVAPDVWILSGNRFIQVPDPDPTVVTAATTTMGAATEPPTILIGRE
jgi:N-methylhydantoinase A/oxoprolinase/acetone carboxylase beta subunit